ncbi:F0F1 ATP synthase subunit A [Sulfidibacter corallicola]|uniref:ATP synthase subunit a n=1 Tax=Sulfidibacter corallicola TaxID=2818388 RepID=A0A8A4TVG3_SULCO|nr:F0F1 ATP synthase subunit A [Sulfidibacter corallicola]QTD53114.1 F0F1 ATP synthase subunit A [Sulfidibacter corallicola]
METHPSLWTLLLEGALHIDAIMWDHVVAAGIVFLFLTILGFMVKSKVSLIPSGLQQVIEVTLEGLLGMLDENIGPHGRKYLPLIGTLAFFIFMANFLGMVPSFSAATGNFNTTIACALIVFFYYNFEGLRENGVGYLKHFMGPIPLLAPLMIPIEIIGHLARPFSLGVRLFGNISGEHIVVLVFYTQLFAWLVPVPLMVIGLFAAFLQTFVFIMLTMVYIAGAIAHDH